MHKNYSLLIFKINENIKLGKKLFKILKLSKIHKNI